MAYDENKTPLGLDETTELDDDDVLIVQKDGEDAVKKIRKGNLDLSGNAKWTPQGETTSDDVGGIDQGTDLGTSPINIADTLRQIFYPDVAGAIALQASVAGGLRETGNVAALTSVNFQAVTSKGTHPITSVQFFRGSTLIFTVASPNPNGGTEVNPNPETITTNSIYTARLLDGILPPVISNAISYTFAFAYYYGVGDQGLTAAQVAGLTKDVRTNTASLTREFAPTNQVAYFAYPASYPALTSIKDQNNFETISDWTVRIENITNIFGQTTSYRIYEFNNLFTSAGFSWTFAQ